MMRSLKDYLDAKTVTFLVIIFILLLIIGGLVWAVYKAGTSRLHYINAYNSTAEELSKCEATKSSIMNDYNWYVEFYYDSVCSLETPPEECASGVYE